MQRSFMRIVAMLFALALVAVACGSDASTDDSASAADTSSESTSSSEEAMDDEEDAMDDEGDDAVAASYGPAEDCSADEGGLNIGTLLPETGALAFLGDPLIQAVEMAICDINAAGGVNGQLVTRSAGDSGTDPDIANQTVDRLLSTEGVDAIVGAAASGISGAVIDKITSAPAVQCSPSNTAAGLGVDGDDGYYFRAAPSDDLQAPALADLILGDGYTSVAIVPRADDWGVGIRSFFVPAFEDGGGEVVYQESYAPESTSFDDVVADVVASGPEAVVLASFEEGLQILRTMIEQGVGPDVIPIYITDGMASGNLGEQVVEGTDLDPGIVQGMRGTQPSAAPASGTASFPDAFAAYAPGVDTVFSSQSYDCAIVIALAAHAAGSNDAAAIQSEMVNVTRGGEKCNSFGACAAIIDAGGDADYDGASGPIDFLDAGEPSVGSYDIYEYDADGLQVVIEQLVFEATGGDDAPEATPVAYGPAEDCSADEGGLNIGTLLPETGALAFLGDPLIQAVEMAICDINAAGGVNGQLVTRSAGDSGTDPDIANQTVDRLLSTEGVDAIVGAAASGISGAVIDKITSAPAVQCSPSNTAAGLGVDGDDGYYFRAAPSDDLQAPALADLILGDGYTSVAIVPRADDWGVGIRSFFVPAFEDGGGEVVYQESYAPESTSFDDVVADVVASGPEAVVLASFEEGLQILRTMIEQGVGPDVIPIYITDGMASGNLGEQVVEGTDLDPGIVQGMRGTQPSAAPASGTASFPDAFAAYAPGVDTVFSSQSYDCAIVIALAAHAAGSNDAAAIQSEMVNVTRGGEKCNSFGACAAIIDAGGDADYDGASGPIDFLDAGEPSVGSYDIYEYDADGLQVVIEQLVFEAIG